LYNSTSSLTNLVKIRQLNSSRAEDVSISKVLSGEITNGEGTKNNFCAGFNDVVELVIDNFPFSINDLLEIIGVFKSDFGIIFLSSELKLDSEQ
jgi:hypothetical protein